MPETSGFRRKEPCAPQLPEQGRQTMKHSILAAALVALAVSACGKKEEPVAAQPVPSAQEQMKESAAQAVEAAKESVKAAGDAAAAGAQAVKQEAAAAVEATKDAATAAAAKADAVVDSAAQKAEVAAGAVA